MAEFYRNIVAWIHSLQSFDRIVLVACLAMLSLSCIKVVIKLHVNAKKFKVKIVPIILSVIFLFLTVFIASV